jgi:hypothetical protein
MKKCAHCEKETENKKYCSMECYYDYRRSIVYKGNCLNCGKEITFKNGAYKRLGRMRFCSHQCKNRKFHVDDSYFSGNLTEDKLITLGQFISCAELESKNIVKIFSNELTLIDIKNKLNCNYDIKKSDKGLLRVEILSEKMFQDLLNLGVIKNKLFQDVPRGDLWEGLKSTHCYWEDEQFCFFQTECSKISRWVEDEFDTEVITKNYRNNSRKIFGCYYINIWKKKNN